MLANGINHTQYETESTWTLLEAIETHDHPLYLTGTAKQLV